MDSQFSLHKDSIDNGELRTEAFQNVWTTPELASQSNAKALIAGKKSDDVLHPDDVLTKEFLQVWTTPDLHNDFKSKISNALKNSKEVLRDQQSTAPPDRSIVEGLIKFNSVQDLHFESNSFIADQLTTDANSLLSNTERSPATVEFTKTYSNLTERASEAAQKNELLDEQKKDELIVASGISLTITGLFTQRSISNSQPEYVTSVSKDLDRETLVLKSIWDKERLKADVSIAQWAPSAGLGKTAVQWVDSGTSVGPYHLRNIDFKLPKAQALEYHNWYALNGYGINHMQGQQDIFERVNFSGMGRSKINSLPDLPSFDTEFQKSVQHWNSLVSTHNSELQKAGKIVQSPWAQTGCLLGAEATNRVVDNIFFQNTFTSSRTAFLDAASTAIMLVPKFGPLAKGIAIVAAHTAFRTGDEYEQNSLQK